MEARVSGLRKSSGWFCPIMIALSRLLPGDPRRAERMVRASSRMIRARSNIPR